MYALYIYYFFWGIMLFCIGLYYYHCFSVCDNNNYNNLFPLNFSPTAWENIRIYKYIAPLALLLQPIYILAARGAFDMYNNIIIIWYSKKTIIIL